MYIVAIEFSKRLAEDGIGKLYRRPGFQLEDGSCLLWSLMF